MLPTSKRILLVWLYFHFMVFLLSYSSYGIFNNFGDHEIRKFWPFVTYQDYRDKFITTKLLPNGIQEGFTSNEKEVLNFYGIFPNYDITEFLIYSLVGILIFNLVATSDKFRKR